MSERLARRFHETYERLAPRYGYETRPETRKFDPNSNNGRLMIAVCEELACCDGPGGIKTYANQVCMPINGKVRCIDRCIHQIVAALNAGGVETVASCCGHGEQDGRIDLADGRVLTVAADRGARTHGP